MTTSEVPQAAPATEPSWRDKAVAYGWTSSVLGVQNLLCIPLIWVLLDEGAQRQPGVRLGFAFFSLAIVGTIAVGRSLDDLAGLEDGIDEANYVPRDGELLRSVVQKPLVSGVLTKQQVQRFALRVGLATLACIAAGVVAVPDKPVQVLPLLAGALVLTTQISSGIRLSYRPFGLETGLLLGFAAPVALGYALLDGGRLRADVVVCAFLFGLWQVQISVFSNLLDVVGDAAASRRTLAVRYSASVNRALIAALFLAGWSLIALSAGADWLPTGTAVALVPALAVQALQAFEGCVRGRVLVARHLGFAAILLAMTGLIVGTAVSA